MTIAISQVNPATDNFLDWVEKTNDVIDAMTNNALTAGGANTVGLAYLTGSFTTTGLFANTISGGVYGTPTVLTMTSNVSFSSNVVFNGANNSFGAINNMHVIGATGQNRMVIANTTSNKLMFTTLLDEVKAVDGAGSGIDADLFDGEDNMLFVKTYGSVMTNGQSWGSTFASANSDITRHVMLYSNTYGLNATTNFVNYVSPDSHRWFAGSTSLASLGASSLSIVVPTHTAASVVGSAGLRVPHGTLPTSPVNGDLWSTTAGWFVRTNGATQQLLTMSYLQTIDGAGSGLDADVLDGQQGAWYADIPSRLGYTPVNKAGDTMSGALSISNTNPTINLTSGVNTVSLSTSGTDTTLVSSATGFVRPHVHMYSNTLTVVSTAPTLIAAFGKAAYRSAKFVMSIKNNNANAYTASEILVLHNDGDAFLSEYAIVHSNTAFGSFSANVDATNVRLYFTSTSNNALVKHDATYFTI